MAFEFRLLNPEDYARTVADLDAVGSGDEAALRRTVEACLHRLAHASFGRWHAGFEGLAEDWRRQLQGATVPMSEGALDEIGRIAVALRSLPEYQFSPLGAEERSPNLVVLGEGDGGLYMHLRDHDDWFDTFLLERFEGEVERYHVAESMLLLDDADRERLEALLASVTPPTPLPPGFSESLEGLRDLLQRARSEGARVAVAIGEE